MKNEINNIEEELATYQKFIEETENIGIVKFEPNEVIFLVLRIIEKLGKGFEEECCTVETRA